ncbi:hypothetical protein [Hyphomicrobium sp. MC1]|uniref:hypothetical protein n=1 Tax=Hyphomicrobium sp. (strain MC1) TaxID=717785 RepID=UPI000213EAD6|nr:hypothetical protein [Hyphomicrobium sp. MC1]CCB64077.1 protein of unknown function [Hyphomicrobium sp. MC1]
MSDQQWPEFHRWYELTMEEQRIYAEEDECDRDRLLDAVDEERGPLERAMRSRTPQNLQQLGMLAVIELRYADKRDDADIPYTGFLAFGISERAAHLTEGVLKLAITQNLLPGVVIHGGF